MKKLGLWIAVAFSMLMAGTGPSPLQRADIQHDLNGLTKRGITYRMLGNDLIELSDPLSGEKHLKSLREPSEATIRSWAAQRGIPILEIDPNTIDTSQYSGWYNYWTTVPLGNGIGNRLVISDLNHNGQQDVYAVYLDTLFTESQARVYEMDSSGNSFFRYQYVPRQGSSRLLVDADRDSLLEIVFSFGGVVTGYEQHSMDSLPIYQLLFAHDRYYHNSSPGSTGIYIGDLDGDSLSDFLYQGTGPDPNDSNIAISKTYVAEYDPTQQNFVRVWSTQFLPGSGAAGFAVADIDNNGRMDFVATHSTGEVYVAENTADNEYTLVWQDSTPYVNFYDIGSGDVDNNGKIKFFTGAVMSNGSWTLVYEADSNNAYSAKFLFHLLSGGLLAGTQYIVIDMDGDKKNELAIKVGGEVYIFKLIGNNSYSLWYLRRENAIDAVTFYDVDHDGRQDMVISRFAVNSQGRGRLYADVYKATKLVSVEEEHELPLRIRLQQCYPNPFNPRTTIEYSLEGRERVILRVYNLLGQPVAILVNEEQIRGRYNVVWNAAGVASGIYFCRLEAAGISLSKKLLLIR